MSSTSASFSVTNDGVHTEEVTPAFLRLQQLGSSQHFTVASDSSKDPTFIDDGGFTRSYKKQTFNVPSGSKDLTADIAWNNGNTLERISLVTPSGKLAAYSIPFGDGLQQHGHVDVRDPASGTWTAILWTRAGPIGYTGPVQLDVSTYNLVTAGVVSPASRTLAPGTSGSFAVQVTFPSESGDQVYQIENNGNWGETGAIPVILRTVIPSEVSSARTFSGTISGGNGRNAPTTQQTFVFNVPGSRSKAGARMLDATVARNLSLNVTLPDPGYSLIGFLINPDGFLVDTQSTINAFTEEDAPAGDAQSLQFFVNAPEPGQWKFVLTLLLSIPGNKTSEPLTGSLAFNTVNVRASGEPDSNGTVIKQSSTRTATVSITNTGNTTKDYFVDARLNSQARYDLGSAQIALPSFQNVAFSLPAYQ